MSLLIVYGSDLRIYGDMYNYIKYLYNQFEWLKIFITGVPTIDLFISFLFSTCFAYIFIIN